MNFRATYNSPIGEITIITNETRVLFLGFMGQCLKSASEISPLILTSVCKQTDLLECPLSWAELQSSEVETSCGCNFKERYFDDAMGNLPPVPLTKTFRWLDVYFSGTQPDFTPPLAPQGTDFQKLIWNLLLKIPYGKTTTYGEIATKAAKIRGVEKMSNRAVGNAIGKNPISLIIPCHRVIGANGSLTGYAGGLDKKEFLLKLEKAI